MRLDHICLGCMENKGDALVCPSCGYREGTPPAAPHYLKPGTVLAGKYLIGRGLGHGGFGTTYLAYDLVLGIKLAVKEYLPQDCASRAPGQTQVTPFSGEGEQRFNQGLESFLQEARTLARFDGQPGIVGVRDFFTENNTAYLVMNYLEGITLKDVLVGRAGKPMPFDQLMHIMLPVMSALERVHAAGLLHRDVSPDNIFLTRQGQVVLIDFGAARQSMGVERSMSVILKPGYAPQEQYRSHGRQGPWTDVYALGACMYRALTGVIPPEALERIPRDTLEPPSRLGIRLPRGVEEALLRAMAVESQDRFQSVAAFRKALTGGASGQGGKAGGKAGGKPGGKQGPPPNNKKRGKQEYPLKEKKRKGRAGGVFLALLLICLLAAVVIAVMAVLDQTLDGLPMTMGGQESATPTAPPLFSQTPLISLPASELPSATPAQTASPEPSQTPAPEYTGEPALRPGASPSQSLADFVPRSYTYTVVGSGDGSQGWLNGKMPVSRPDVLCASFGYDMETRETIGEIYIYFLDAVGNLKYGSDESRDFGTLLPAKCEVGETFNGYYGSGEIVAVNYSATIEGTVVSGAVVVRVGGRYLFFVPGEGLALIREGLDSGSVLQRVVSSTEVERELFETYVTP